MVFRLFTITFVLSAYCVAQTPSARYAVPDINGRATLLVRPEFSNSSSAYAADSSTLSVKVVVDVDGKPTSAVCSETCHPAMKQAAERAAMESRFSPLIVNGRAVEYEGKLLYTIAIRKIDWFRFGTAMQSILNFDNISVGPVAQFLTNEFASERARLANIDNEKNVSERIRKIGAEIDHFKRLLKGKNQWIFRVGLVTRDVTFWTMAGERINRQELREALKRVAEVAETAPPDITEDFVAALKNFSKFTFDPEIPERELRQELTKLSATLRNYPR